MNTKPLYIRNGQVSSKPTPRVVKKANPIVSVITGTFSFINNVLDEYNASWLTVAFVVAVVGFYKLAF